MLNYKQMAKNTGNHFIQLTKSDSPNYKVAATASGILGIVSLASMLEGDFLTSYLAISGFLFTSGLAIKQYGIQNTYVTLSNHMSSLFTSKNNNKELPDTIPMKTFKKNS